MSTAGSVSSEGLAVRYWVAGCSVSEDLWKYRRESTTVTCDARGRSLEGSEGDFVWPDYLDAAELDLVIVEGEGLDTARFQLWWSADESFVAGRSADPAGDGSSSGEVRFELRGRPEWKGLVRRFRLTWSGTPSPASRIVGARGVRGP